MGKLILTLPNYPPPHSPHPYLCPSWPLVTQLAPRGHSRDPLLWPKSAMPFLAPLPPEPSSAWSSGLGPDSSRPLGGECWALPTSSWEANFGPQALPPSCPLWRAWAAGAGRRAQVRGRLPGARRPGSCRRRRARRVARGLEDPGRARVTARAVGVAPRLAAVRRARPAPASPLGL